MAVRAAPELSALNRLPSSNAAQMVAALSFPIPLKLISLSGDIDASSVSLPAAHSMSVLVSRTFFPLLPVLSRIASNSVLPRAWAPFESSRSLGRSSALISFNFISVLFLCRAEVRYL